VAFPAGHSPGSPGDLAPAGITSRKREREICATPFDFLHLFRRQPASAWQPLFTSKLVLPFTHGNSNHLALICMLSYEDQAIADLRIWQTKMQKRPSLANKLAKGLQHKINNIIPEKVHRAFTVTIKQMVRGVLFGARYTTSVPLAGVPLQVRERFVREKITFYKRAAATEGGLTGAGGFLLALADFPLFLGLKLQLLFEIATLYGHDVRDYRERIFLLRVFQLAFSSQEQRSLVYGQIQHWDQRLPELPPDIHQFDWRSFQLEYRDYLDLAKLLQLIPGVGAVVGVVVNYRLTEHLGQTAINAYRMRWEAQRLR
jgi:hypothetical protein